jgi:hypothetical protein
MTESVAQTGKYISLAMNSASSPSVANDFLVLG